MKTIEQQIEALTQELWPYPKGWLIEKEHRAFYYFDGEQIIPSIQKDKWNLSLFASTNKAEVEDYADCYRRLKLYQLIGKQKEKEYPLIWGKVWSLKRNHGTDFFLPGKHRDNGNVCGNFKQTCVLGGVWFSRNEDRLEALEICGITKELQERCAKYGLGGA